MKDKIDKLMVYIDLLNKWSSKYNLVSYRSINELMIDHIIDSFSLMEVIKLKDQVIGDIGTGPGLPGIVLSILNPDCKFLLIEPKKKYYRFLKKVKDLLNLRNVELYNNRVENIEDFHQFNMLISRAVGGLGLILKLRKVDPECMIVLYKGANLLNELNDLKQNNIKIKFIKKIKILEMYNRNHYIIALNKIG